MRICFCNTNKNWGGGEKWHVEMAIAIAKEEKFNVSFMMAEESAINKKLNSDKIKKLYFDIDKFSFLNPIKRYLLTRLFKEQRFDLLIFNGPNELKFVTSIAKRCGIKKVVYRRGSDVVVKNKLINRYLLTQKVDTIIANSIATKKALLKSGIPIDSKITIINNGIHPPTNQLGSSSSDNIIIGAIGRLEQEKGFDLLIQSAKILKDRELDFKIKIAGEGRQYVELNRAIEINGLQSYVELVGFKKDIYQFLSGCNIFALSSRYEGFGYVTVEAMFAGLPIVAFKTSAALEIVQDEETGVLVDSYNIDEFADALQKLIEEAELRIRLGQKGQQRAYQHYSFDKSVEKITRLFNS